jgi:hypothetical protein
MILPVLLSFTGDKLAARYSEATTTGRTDLMANDIGQALENPILGVGVGRSRYFRDHQHSGLTAHTEFTRILSEHGFFGLLSLVFLGCFAFEIVFRSSSIADRAFAVTMFLLGLGSMMHAAMRLSAIGFCIGLSGIRLYHTETLAEFLYPRLLIKSGLIDKIKTGNSPSHA